MKRIFLFLNIGCVLFFLSGCGNFSLDSKPDQQSQNIQPGKELTEEAFTKQLLAGPVKKCIDEKDSGASFSCFEEYLKDEVRKSDPELAFKSAKILYDKAPSVKAHCHPLAHSIGHAGVEKYPDISEAYLHGDDFCWSGYYHGVLEKYIEKIGLENLPKRLNNVCDNIPGKEAYSFAYYNCVHGLGHGVMAVKQDHLFDALELCDIMNGDWEKQSCYSGVFMENVIVDGINHKSNYLRPNEPLYPCNAVKETYKQSCYLMQTSYMLKVTDRNFKKVFDLCEKADKNYVSVCYRSLGRDASGSSVSDVVKTREKCYIGKNYEQRSECITGAVKDFISYFHSDVQGKELCNSLEDQQMKDSCLKTAQSYYKKF